MIVGIGTDFIEIERVKKACNKCNFINRYFTEKEQQLFRNNFSKVAGNFAVKEAVSKVFGTGFDGFQLRDIEVLRDTLGKPYVILYNGAEEKAMNLGISNIHISITNTKDFVQAIAVGEGDKS